MARGLADPRFDPGTKILRGDRQRLERIGSSDAAGLRARNSALQAKTIGAARLQYDHTSRLQQGGATFVLLRHFTRYRRRFMEADTARTEMRLQNKRRRALRLESWASAHRPVDLGRIPHPKTKPLSDWDDARRRRFLHSGLIIKHVA